MSFLFDDEKVTIKGNEFKIETQRNRGNTARVSISGNLIKIKLPLYMSSGNAQKTYTQFKEWAIRRLEKIDHSTLNPKPKFIEFNDGQELEAMGKKFTISIIQEGKKSTARMTDNNRIIIKLAADLNEEGKKKKTYQLVRREISKNVMGDLVLHVKGLNGRHFDLEFNGIKLRDQSTRWGSCSRSTKNISINFRLLLATDEIRDYVIIHELAHLKHPNHSERFWKLVGTAIPDYKERRRWLNKNGNTLGTEVNPSNPSANPSSTLTSLIS